MKIKDVPEGSKIICNGATAEVLSKGTMGTRVNVLTVPDVNTGFPLGKQIWSNESIVELAPGEPGIGKFGVPSVKAIKLPLTLF